MQAKSPPTQLELEEEGEVQRHAEAECERALGGVDKARALAVRPEAGFAVAFWHTFEGEAAGGRGGAGESDPNMWHAGCVGRSGRGRVALQKFKTPMKTEHRERLASDEARWRPEWVEQIAKVRRSVGVDADGAPYQPQQQQQGEDMDDVVAMAEKVMGSFFDD